MKQQSCQSEEKGKPGQRSVKRDSANFAPTTRVFSVGNEQSDVVAIPERMVFIPVIRCGAIDSLVDSLKNQQKETIK